MLLASTLKMYSFLSLAIKMDHLVACAFSPKLTLKLIISDVMTASSDGSALITGCHIILQVPEGLSWGRGHIYSFHCLFRIIVSLLQLHTLRDKAYKVLPFLSCLPTYNAQPLSCVFKTSLEDFLPAEITSSIISGLSNLALNTDTDDIDLRLYFVNSWGGIQCLLIENTVPESD